MADSITSEKNSNLRNNRFVFAKGNDLKEFDIENFSSHSSPSYNFDVTIDSLYVGYPYMRLLELFQVRDSHSIISFINKHFFLNDYLLEIYKAIRNSFPEENLRIDLYDDPEGQMSSELAIYIQSTDSPGSALEKLDSFDNDFWIDRIDKYEGYISVNIEYK